MSLAVLATTLMLLPEAAFEAVYGTGLYPALSSLFATLTSWTLLPLGLAVLPITCGIFLWRTLSPWRPLANWRRAGRLLLLALLLLSLYLIVWGANYRRPGLLRLVDIEERATTQVEVDAFGRELLGWVRAAAAELDPDSDPARAEDEVAEVGPSGQAGATAVATGSESAGAATGAAVARPARESLTTRVTEDPEAAAALADIARQLEQFSLELGWPATVPATVKLLPPGTLLSSGYAGMLFPFTLEPQLDAGLSRISRVAVGAHELAHAAGFAHEADADMAALIAGLRAQHPLARYAVALSLLSRSLDSLSPQQRTFIVSNLPVRALRDLGEARERSRRYLNASLADRVTAVYNRLLRGQGVESGVDAYRQVPVTGALLAAEGVLPPAPLVVPDGGIDGNERPLLVAPAATLRQSLATLGR